MRLKKTVTFKKTSTFIGYSKDYDSDTESVKDDATGWLVEQEFYRNQRLLADTHFSEASSSTAPTEDEDYTSDSAECDEVETVGSEYPHERDKILFDKDNMRSSVESFFTDYTTETRRISLTPSLLRGYTSTQTSMDSNSTRPERRLDWLDKKEDQVDKKPKRIRSLFSIRRRTDYPKQIWAHQKPPRRRRSLSVSDNSSSR